MEKLHIGCIMGVRSGVDGRAAALVFETVAFRAFVAVDMRHEVIIPPLREHRGKLAKNFVTFI